MKNKLNHHGHVLTSINELEKIFKRDYSILNIHHKINYNKYKPIDYIYYEIISNVHHWFRVQIPIKKVKDNNKKYYFSIYGTDISCLEFFKIYTKLSPITCNEFINKFSPGGN